MTYLEPINLKSAIGIKVLVEKSNLKEVQIQFPIFKNAEVVHGSYAIQGEYSIRNLPYDISGFDSFPQTDLIVTDNAIYRQESLNQTRIQDGLFIGSSSNWYHFLIEILPRGILWKRQFNLVTPVIFHAPVPKSIYRIVERIGGSTPVLVRDAESVLVESLQVAIDGRYESRPNMMRIAQGQNIFTDRLNDFSLIRDWLELNFPSTKSRSPRKIFLARGQNSLRPMSNFREIREGLEGLGYVTIFPETLTIEEQISSFAYAESIIAEGGAALTNLIFAKNLKHFIHIEANPSKFVSNFWQQFAESLSIPSQAALGKPEVFLGQLTGRFKVNLKMLRNLID